MQYKNDKWSFTDYEQQKEAHLNGCASGGEKTVVNYLILIIVVCFSFGRFFLYLDNVLGNQHVNNYNPRRKYADYYPSNDNSTDF